MMFFLKIFSTKTHQVHYTAANFSNELVEAQEYKKSIKLKKQMMKSDLLTIDEMSYLTFNQHQSELLLKVVSDRS